jgi:hypothetical protein
MSLPGTAATGRGHGKNVHVTGAPRAYNTDVQTGPLWPALLLWSGLVLIIIAITWFVIGAVVSARGR